MVCEAGLRGDDEGGGAVDGVADVGVEEAVVAGSGGDGLAEELGGGGGARCEGEGAPGGFGLFNPGGGVRGERGDGEASGEGGFLGVYPVLLEGAGGAVEEEARGGLGGEHGGSAARGEARIVEADVEGVIHQLCVGRVVAVGADAGGNGVGPAEEGDALIDEVRAEVEEEAVGGVRNLFPGVGAGQGAEAVPMGVEGDETAQGDGFEKLVDGEEVGIPAAVVEGGGDEVACVGEIDELGGLLAGGGEGLVNDDVAAGEQALTGPARDGWRWGWR